jgi:uncharacterized membrane protein
MISPAKAPLHNGWNAAAAAAFRSGRRSAMASEAPPAAPHVEETVAKIAELHAAHYREAGALQKFASSATARVAQPRTLAVVTAAVAGWIVLNLAMTAAGWRAPDPYPFPLLSAAVSTCALYLTAMILIAQRHDDELATRRDQLTLEIAILSERKTAKVIALLEAFRRNDWRQSDERDKVAEALAEPLDPQAVLDAIKAAHEDAASGEGESG